MALIPDNVPTRESDEEIRARFAIAQHGRPTDAQLAYQADIAEVFTGLAVMSRQVVESADGRGSDCGVAPVVI
ncbi:hypothetical protein ACWKWN_08720, partial [Microbacterium trichothecenolyticum]